MRPWRKMLFIPVLTPLLFLSIAWTGHLGTSDRAQSPALNQDFPDPGLVRTPDGWYYAYATQTITEDAAKQLINIQVARSRDLQTWQFLGEALPVKPEWAQWTQFFWAPDVSYHDGLYYMYFSALPDTESGFCIGAATSENPEGPFTDSGEPLVCGSSFSTIDPMSFDDPATDEKLLYWGSDFEPLKVQELADDRVHLAKGSEPIEVLSPVSNPGQSLGDYRKLLEGAWVMKHDQYYYLFTSGDSCCDPAHYAIMVARSLNAKGPFEFQEDWEKSILVQSDEDYLAPGHNAIAEDSEGHTWIAYHAIDRKHPDLLHRIPNDRDVRRVLLVQPLNWEDGWPRLGRIR